MWTRFSNHYSFTGNILHEGCHFPEETSEGVEGFGVDSQGEVEEIDSNTTLIEFTEIPQALDERWELFTYLF